MDGIIDPDDMVALAPAIAASSALGARNVARERAPRRPAGARRDVREHGSLGLRAVGSTPDWLPALRWIVLAGSVVLAVMLAVGAHRRGRAAAALAAGANLFAALGAAAYAVETVATSHNGPISTSGPSKGDTFGGPGQAVQVGGGPGGHGRTGGRIAEDVALAQMVQGLDNVVRAESVPWGPRSGMKTGASIMAIRWLHRQR